MRRTKVISDSIVSPLGLGSRENYEAVLAGCSGVRRHEGCFGVPQPFAASLMDRDELRAEASRRGLPGNLCFFDTVALLSAVMALEGSGVDPASDRTAFLLSTIKGDIEELGTVPDDETLPSASAARLGAYFRNPNPVIVVSDACISGAAAIVQASRMIGDGSFDNVVVVGAEVQSRFIISGFLSLKALSDSPCRPFDSERCGLNAGEAAATLVLGAANARDGEFWEVVGGAVRNDANHISGPSRTGEGSFNCLRQVLKDVRKEDLAFVNVHGTATAYNDEMESIALERAGLGDVPVNALKGVYGHTMGAAGVLESIISMRACEDGRILATKGFCKGGTSRPVSVSAENRETDRKSFIKLLSGFGGCNAAVLFRLNEASPEDSCRADSSLPDSSEDRPTRLKSVARVRLDSKDTSLSEAYRSEVGNWPKFYKMDSLCKAGFIAAERLLAARKQSAAEDASAQDPRVSGGDTFREDMGVIIFTHSGPLCNDRHFEATARTDEWFPSPSLFVYTLANVVTGELAIRNGLRGESSCYVLGSRDEALMEKIVREAFGDGVTRSLICGWLECRDDDSFEADLSLVELSD